ncbi:MAG TPA: nuclear transport factor 2 family protein [Kofleriaceae bacterium]
MSNLERTRAYLRAFETRDGSNLDYYATDVVQRELPNLLVKAGATRDLAALRRGMEAGKASVAEERYEVVSMIEQGETVAVEAIWSAKLNIGFGTLSPGDTMRAYLAMFITWRDGLIVSQRNYDCFEPF